MNTTMKLFPGTGTQPVELTLGHVPWIEFPPFEAISYVWGNPKKTSKVICNGKALHLTANLHAALRSLRLPSEPRIFWADAVCINQRDNNERGRQVRRMKDIYTSAKRVIIWLGEGHTKSSLGTELVIDLSRACLQYVAEGGLIDTVSFSDERANTLFGRFRSPSGFPRFEAFASMIHEPWFTRAWVVQELAHASEATIIYGNSSLDWEDFINAVTVQSHLNLYLANHEQSTYIFLLQKAREQYISGERSTLLSLLFRYRIFESTDPRDKIYSLSALIRGDPAEVQPLQADYNIDTRQLYCSIAKELLKGTTNLNILSVPRRFQENSPFDLPSWVPDWTVTRLSACLGLANYSDINDISFTTSKSSHSRIRFNDHEMSLGVDGHIVDEVADVGPVMRTDEVPWTYFHGFRVPKCAWVLEEWLKVALCNNEETYVTGEPVLDAFVQTLVTESTSETIEELRNELQMLRNFATIAKWFRRLPSFVPDQLISLAIFLMRTVFLYQSQDQMSLDFRIHLSSLSDRRIFRTRKGYIGLTSALTGISDAVVVAQGARVPLILRKTGSSWTLQGDCFVRGIMKGEAYSERSCKPMWIV